MYASRVASANPTHGAGLMLDAIAAVFLGQSMTEEGEPRVLATVAGVLILGIIGNGLTQLNVDSYVRDILTGSIVIAAVAVSSFERHEHAELAVPSFGRRFSSGNVNLSVLSAWNCPKRVSILFVTGLDQAAARRHNIGRQ